jgi:hypothetical protein
MDGRIRFVLVAYNEDMARRPFCLILFPAFALSLALAGCAAVDPGEADKAKMEAMLNSELMTGDTAQTIEAFFQRHGIAFTYNPAIRRYAATVDMGDKVPLAVYVYTDEDKKMTVSLVQAPKPMPEAAMPRQQQRPRDTYIDLPGASPPRNRF